MNGNSQEQKELELLLSQIVDSTADPSDIARLEELVLGHPERLRFVRNFFEVEVLLEAESAVPYHDALSRPQPAAHLSTVKTSWGNRRFFVFTAVVGALAAALLLAVVLPVSHPSADNEMLSEIPDAAANASPPSSWASSQPPAPVATISTQEGAEWVGKQLAEGQTVHEGETISLLRGKAHISVGFGAEIIAEGPFQLTFLAHDKVQLDSGEVAVNVAKWAKGFTVVTDTMEVVDLSTTFTVSATQDASAQTNVLKGLVRVHQLKGNSSEKGSVLVSAGEGFTIDGLGQRKTLQQASSDLLSRLDFGDLAPYRPVELHNTGVGLGVGDEDAHWRIVAGTDGDFDGPTHAVVCKAHQRWLPNEIDTSQWVSTVNWGFTTARSVYTFQTTFDLTDYDLTTTQLFGRFLADNGIQEIRVNGKPVDVKAWVDNALHVQFNHEKFRFVNVADELIQGTNVIEVDVFNGISQQNVTEPNPMALRVEWYAFGRTKEPNR